MKRLAYSLGFTAALAGMLLSGCTKKNQTPGVTDDEVVLGASVPLSGPAAIWGNLARGMEAYAQHVNQTGGIHGRKIRLIIKDDAYTPGKAVANVREMADEVFAVVGQLGTAVVGATREVLLEKKIPMISPYGNVRMWMDTPEEDLRYAFVAYPDYLSEGEYLARFASEDLEVDTVAVFYQNDDYGKTGLEGVEKAASEIDTLDLAAAVPYEVATGELSTHARKLQESAADAVVLYATAKHGAMIVKEMAKIGYSPKLLASFPLGDPIMFALAGDLWNGVHVSLAGGYPGLSEEADRYFEIVTGINPDLKKFPNFATIGVNALLLALEGIERTGRNLTREAFIEAMESINGWSEGGIFPISFDRTRRHGMNAIRLARAENGAYTFVKERVEFPPLF